MILNWLLRCARRQAIPVVHVATPLIDPVFDLEHGVPPIIDTTADASGHEVASPVFGGEVWVFEPTPHVGVDLTLDHRARYAPTVLDGAVLLWVDHRLHSRLVAHVVNQTACGLGGDEHVPTPLHLHDRVGPQGHHMRAGVACHLAELDCSPIPLDPLEPPHRREHSGVPRHELGDTVEWFAHPPVWHEGGDVGEGLGGCAAEGGLGSLGRFCEPEVGGHEGLV